MIDKILGGIQSDDCRCLIENAIKKLITIAGKEHLDFCQLDNAVVFRRWLFNDGNNIH